jgi:hypothetical protein
LKVMTMSAFTVRVVNDTGEELELDDASLERGAWNGEWILPVRIPAHSNGMLRVTDEGRCVEATKDECCVVYFIGGDPDRPLYFHVLTPGSRGKELVEVWTPPMCSTRVLEGSGVNSLLVEVSPANRHYGQACAA